MKKLLAFLLVVVVSLIPVAVFMLILYWKGIL